MVHCNSIQICIPTNQEYLVNVSYDISNPNTLKRETTALLEAMEYFKLDRSYLITSEVEDVIELQSKQIKIIPMWKWLLLDEL